MRRLVMILFLIAGQVHADDRLVRFYADPALLDSGLIKHIAPRFSLKTQVRVEVVSDPAEADLVLDRRGRALFSGLGETWHLDQRGQTAGAERFAKWLRSDIGVRTIHSFAPDGTPLFSEPEVQAQAPVVLEMSGDAVMGKQVSYLKCGRCHVTETGSGQVSIGSTPSFAVMRSFEDWELRFTGFYILKPHPAFTQISEVTYPFPHDRPSPIAPIELTLTELEAIVAYVATINAANLGAPLEHQ